jgi:hypothetical protein
MQSRICGPSNRNASLPRVGLSCHILTQLEVVKMLSLIYNIILYNIYKYSIYDVDKIYLCMSKIYNMSKMIKER